MLFYFEMYERNKMMNDDDDESVDKRALHGRVKSRKLKYFGHMSRHFSGTSSKCIGQVCLSL